MENLAKKLKTEVIMRENSADAQVVFKEIVENDMYNFKLLNKFEKFKPFICIDAGAHIGIFSRFFLEMFQESKVIGFEPNPDNFLLLEKNVESFTPRVTVINKGIGTKDEYVMLYPSINNYETGSWTMTPSDSHNKNLSIKVEAIDFNKFIEELVIDGNQILLKLDLEGYEAEIIKSLTYENLRKVSWLILEEHHIPIDHTKLLNAGFLEIYNPFASKRHFVYYNAASMESYSSLVLKYSYSSTKASWQSRYNCLFENSHITLRRIIATIIHKLMGK